MKEAVAKIEKIDEDLACSISDIKKFIPNYMNEIDNSYLNMLIDKFKSLKVHINDIISCCRNTLFSTFFVYLYSEIQNVLSDCILNKKFTIQHIKSLKIIEQNGDLDSTKNQNRSEKSNKRAINLKKINEERKSTKIESKENLPYRLKQTIEHINDIINHSNEIQSDCNNNSNVYLLQKACRILHLNQRKQNLISKKVLI